jgi:aromatic-L-amino-acid decarboxylase
MQTDGRVFLAPAAIDGMTCLRVCFVNFRTRSDEVGLILEVAQALGDALAGAGTQ